VDGAEFVEDERIVDGGLLGALEGVEGEREVVGSRQFDADAKGWNIGST